MPGETASETSKEELGGCPKNFLRIRFRRYNAGHGNLHRDYHVLGLSAHGVSGDGIREQD